MAERPLYRILGVTTASTPTEIKKAYHKLALENHPDKAGAQNADKFKQIQAAYDVLSDPAKRQIYDKYGEQGLSQLGSAPDGVSEVLTFVSAANMLSVLMLSVLLALILILIFMAFLCVKVEDRVDWKWTSVFVPLYILDVFIALVGIAALLKSLLGCCVPLRTEDDNVPTPRMDFLGQLSSFFNAIHILGWAVFIVTVSAGLQRRSDGHEVNWWHYFVPVLVAECSLLISSLLAMPRTRDTLFKQGITAPIGLCPIVTICIFDFFIKACRVLQIFLICARVMDDITSSWWAVLVPFYVMFFLMVCESTLLASVRTSAVYDEDGELVGSGVRPCSTCCASFFMMGLPLATVLMIAAKLEGTRDIPLEQCFIPLWLMVSLGMCIMLCTGCMLIIATKSMEDDINVMEAHAKAEEARNAETARQFESERQGASNNETGGGGVSNNTPAANNSHPENSNAAPMAIEANTTPAAEPAEHERPLQGPEDID